MTSSSPIALTHTRPVQTIQFFLSILGRAIVLLGLLGAFKFAFAWSPLQSAKEVQAQLKNPQLRVVDIRPAKSYADFHIEGAQNAPFALWRGPASNPGKVPNTTNLSKLVQGLGITAKTPVIIASTGVDDIDFGTAAWVYWVLKELGVEQIAILNGGMKAWAHAGFLLDDEVTKVSPSTFQPRWSGRWTASKNDVLAATQKNNVLLIDSRPDVLFKGETRHASVKLPGTIKGGINHPFQRWFVPASSSPNFASFVSTSQSKTEAAKLQPKANGSIAFCNTGHWSAITWFALSEIAGQRNVKLYPESLVEWSQDAKLPMDNVPSRAKQLLINAKLWSDKS
jgi:thiosulfate/3-mercaptopyruvate sulfurtransferase